MVSRSSRLSALGLTLGAFLTAGCLGGGTPSETAAPAVEASAASPDDAEARARAEQAADRPPPVAPRTPPPQIPGSPPSLMGRTAPSAELDLLRGGVASVEELQGDVAILTFWASWCGPCRKEMPELNEVHERLKDRGLKVMAVNVDKNPASARRWVSQNPIHFPVMLDSKAELMGQYHVSYMPTLFVIDRDGTVRRTQVGYKPERLAETVRFVESLL